MYDIDSCCILFHVKDQDVSFVYLWTSLDIGLGLKYYIINHL